MCHRIVTLRIESAGNDFNPATYKAVLTSVECVGPSQVRFKFRKAGGGIDGINLYCQIKGETAWRLVRFYSVSPGTDTTPVKVPGNSEERTYKACGVVKDKEIGIESDLVPVVVKG